MTTAQVAILPDRGVVAVTGPDAEALLQGLITNDMGLLRSQRAIHAGLLTPQGKILFAFMVVRHDGGYLLELAKPMAGDLVKRLLMYRLRANVDIRDVSADYTVAAVLGGTLPGAAGEAVIPDPRCAALGGRLLVSLTSDWMLGENAPIAAPADSFHARRVELGVPEGGRDYLFADTFPHEANFDVFNGVSFEKGCFVGQEVVSRMQHRTTVRKRVVRISAGEDLPPTGTDITTGTVVIGRLGTVAGRAGLAFLKLDRVEDAIQKGNAIAAAGVPVAVASDDLARYRAKSGGQP